MTYNSSGERPQLPKDTYAYDETIQDLEERSRIDGGICHFVANFIDQHKPQTHESFKVLTMHVAGLVDFMLEAGDTIEKLQATLLRGMATGLYVAHESYDGIMSIDDIMNSLSSLGTPDESGRASANQLVEVARQFFNSMPQQAKTTCRMWRDDFQLDTGHAAAFDASFAIMLAAANKEAVRIDLNRMRRQVEAVNDVDWDELLL